MGFMDDFKAAMERGKVAADKWTEEHADDNKRTSDVPLPAENKHATQPEPKHPEDPAAPFNLIVKTEEPLTTTDPAGNTVRFNVLANGRAKLRDPAQYAGQDYKEIARAIILEAANAYINDRTQMPNPADVKTIMLASSRLVAPVTSAMNDKGFDIAFKMLNLTLAREG